MSLIERPCTCHPDDATKPCQRKYAASECQAALTAIMGEGDGVQEVDVKASSPIAIKIMIGELEHEDLHKAFARHRSTAAAAERARIVATLGEWLDNYQDEADHWPVIDDIRDLLAAIERGEV